MTAANGGDASAFARLFTIAGMTHTMGGPSTDQFDMLTALVNWVEKGQAPDSVIGTARTTTQNTDLANATLLGPTVNPGRTRPLCPYPKVARYNGSGSIEDAASFTCR